MNILQTIRTWWLLRKIRQHAARIKADRLAGRQHAETRLLDLDSFDYRDFDDRR